MDVAALRQEFPALADGLARFDAPGGSLVPRLVGEAVATAMTAGMCQRGSLTAVEQLTDATTTGARAAMAAMLGADPAGIVFGRSMTALTMDLARTLARTWGPGDEVVVTRLDHDANVRPWVIAAERAGATVRWLDFDPLTAELDDVMPLLTDRTRLVAVTAASNLLGTRPDVAAVTAAAHAVGALTCVDAVHLAAHAPVDITALGADFLVCSPYKFFGPHLGVLAAAPELLETLHPDKLLPSTEVVPERFELGTLPYELLAGVTAAVEFIAGIGTVDPDAVDVDLRVRVTAGMAAIEQHEDVLLTALLRGFDAIPGLTTYGTPAHRTPTVLLALEGRSPRDVYEALAADGVIAPAGTFYAYEAAHHLGLGDLGGVRVGLAATTSLHDVERLLAGLGALS